MEHLVIGNEHSGTNNGRKVLAETEAYLSDKGIPFTVWKTEFPGHATQLTQEAIAKGYRQLLIVGGDGTFNEVINGLDYSAKDDPVTLGLIPAGSGNDFVRNTKLTGSTQEILDYIFHTEPVWVDCGIANGSRFLNICGFGVDVELLLRQNKIKKYIKGASSYYLATILTILRLRFRQTHCVIDDEIIIDDKIFLVAAGNGRTYGGGFPVVPQADLQDGYLDVCIVSKLPFYKVPSMLLRLIKGKHTEVEKYVRYYKCKHFFMDSPDHTLPVNIDGELNGHAPLDCQIDPHSVKLYL